MRRHPHYCIAIRDDEEFENVTGKSDCLIEIFWDFFLFEDFEKIFLSAIQSNLNVIASFCVTIATIASRSQIHYKKSFKNPFFLFSFFYSISFANFILRWISFKIYNKKIQNETDSRKSSHLIPDALRQNHVLSCIFLD